MSFEALTYKSWYYFYRITHKLRLWSLYTGYDEEFGTVYVETKWFWQNKRPLNKLGS